MGHVGWAMGRYGAYGVGYGVCGAGHGALWAVWGGLWGRALWGTVGLVCCGAQHRLGRYEVHCGACCGAGYGAGALWGAPYNFSSSPQRLLWLLYDMGHLER